ncbi:hypothetical protein BDV12DRAFT_199436 [Aspergillus spectabilis]
MEFEASAARFQEMDKQACTSPQSLCDECRTLFTRLSDSGKFKVSDILYTAETWPMIFYHEANDITNNNTDMVVRDMECWLAAWYGHPVKVFGVSIPFRLSQHRMTPKPAHPVPGSTTFYLVDFPAHIDPEVMLEQGLLSSADVPIDNWEIAGKKEEKSNLTPHHHSPIPVVLKSPSQNWTNRHLRLTEETKDGHVLYTADIMNSKPHMAIQASGGAQLATAIFRRFSHSVDIAINGREILLSQGSKLRYDKGFDSPALGKKLIWKKSSKWKYLHLDCANEAGTVYATYRLDGGFYCQEEWAVGVIGTLRCGG